MRTIKRFEIYWANLDPTQGSEMKKTRPVVVVLPDVMNSRLQHVIVVPLTTVHRSVPFRCSVKIKNKKGQAACEHVRTIDVARLSRKIGKATKSEQNALSSILVEIFTK